MIRMKNSKYHYPSQRRNAGGMKTLQSLIFLDLALQLLDTQFDLVSRLQRRALSLKTFMCLC